MGGREGGREKGREGGRERDSSGHSRNGKVVTSSKGSYLAGISKRRSHDNGLVAILLVVVVDTGHRLDSCERVEREERRVRQGSRNSRSTTNHLVYGDSFMGTTDHMIST